MDAITILLIAVGLAMDAFSVSICSGMASQAVKPPYALRIATFFGGFQALMPLLGWLGGIGLRDLIAGFDHWVALILLVIIGGKMIRESLRPECEPAPLRLGALLVLAVATSIDALAVGLSFSLLNVSITVPIVVIGLVTFVLSLVGVYIGKRVGSLFQSRVQLIGGIILIGIGVRIVVEHL